ncbi:transport ATP-binding protein cydD [Bacillus freudenreichii]|nr:transport ATP-binding protein cydD [Bacillus freudenreichii]
MKKRKRGLPSFPGSRKLYGVLSVTILFEAICIVAQTVFLARAITYLFQGNDVRTVAIDICLFLVAFLIRQALSHSQQLAAERFSEQTGKALRKQLIESYFRLGPRFVQTNGTGQLVTLAMEGIEKVKTFLEIAIPRMIRTFLIPAITVLYVFTLDVTSAVIMTVTVPIVIIFMILLGLAAQAMADKQYETYRILSNHFVDTLKGLETLAYLGQSKDHGKQMSRVNRDYRKATIRTLRVAFLSSFALDFFTSLSIAFVAVGLGFRLIDGSISLLPALTVLILAPEYFLPIRQVGTDYHATLDGQVAMEQVETIIGKNERTHETSLNEGMDWTATSSLQINNLSVAHEPSASSVLKNVQFSWKGYGVIGLLGASGAGKSTFIDVLAGFLQPNQGEITVNGERLDSFAHEGWQKNIAYIPQQPYIFPASLADNIRFYVPDATDDEVENIIVEIGLHSLVEQLPNGIHERIGEGGRTLSGGQEQRVAMARALLSQRPIILLDEPTAHLDIETEYENKQVLLRLFYKKLVFLATHRLHWVKEMDHILVVEQGGIREYKSHEEWRKQYQP